MTTLLAKDTPRSHLHDNLYRMILALRSMNEQGWKLANLRRIEALDFMVKTGSVAASGMPLPKVYASETLKWINQQDLGLIVYNKDRKVTEREYTIPTDRALRVNGIVRKSEFKTEMKDEKIISIRLSDDHSSVEIYTVQGSFASLFEDRTHNLSAS